MSCATVRTAVPGLKAKDGTVKDRDGGLAQNPFDF
jgi:hypothetical protein